ncbi:hypothetical protein ABBQ38_013537 [Trebouxia sp. C0009 RCD-2024]
MSRTMAPSRNFSSHSDLSQMAVGASELIKVQVFVDGRLEQCDGKWGYKGGSRIFQKLSTGFGYAQLMHKMCEKLASAVSLKYLPPGEELSPDNLISVTDDDDVQEMYAEYWRGQSEHDAKQSFRMTLMLFQAFDPQDFEDAEAAWYTTSAEKAAREQGLSPDNSRAHTAGYSSLGSDRSSINSAAAGMHVRTPYEASGWIRSDHNPQETAVGNELDAQDAAYAFEQLKGIKQMPSKSEYQAWQKPGYEPKSRGAKGFDAKEGYTGKDGYAQRYHTQTDSFEEHEAGRTPGLKDQDPVSVLPNHLYSTDDENSTQHLISGSNSAQTQPNTSMQMSGRAASLHLPSISDIYAVIGEDQRALATAPDATAAATNTGGSIHYHEYEPSNLAPAASPFERHNLDAMLTSASKPPIRTPPNGVLRQQPAGFGHQDAYMADAGFLQQITDELTYGHAGMPAVRLQSPQLDGSRGSARPPDRAYSPLFHPPISFLPNPNITPNLHMAPYLNLPPSANQPPHLEAYNSVSPPLVYNLDGGGGGYAQYLPYAREGLETGQIKMNGIQQFVGRGIRDGQGPWGKPEKQLPAVQYLKKQDSGLSHAGSGGSATLNNPVHKVPKDEVKILRRIGEGAFGEVSLATCAIFGSVAVKWLKPGKVERHSQSFWREAEMLSNLNHPNVLRFYGVVVESYAEPNVIGIMTEYMKGGSLAAFLRTEGWLNLRARAEMALSAVHGLAYLHEMSVVHFDLKPDNLLLDGKFHTYDGTVPSLKVADFGLSKQKWGREFVSGVRDLRGTLPYMAPELVSDPERVSEKADVWSLGMVLWEMLTRQVPFTHLTPQQIIAGLMVGNLQPEVPDWCEQEWRLAMESCWEVNPDHRPSLRDLARRLELIMEHAD